VPFHALDSIKSRVGSEKSVDAAASCNLEKDHGLVTQPILKKAHTIDRSLALFSDCFLLTIARSSRLAAYDAVCRELAERRVLSLTTFEMRSEDCVPSRRGHGRPAVSGNQQAMNG
jgi:hypothetical protein